MKLWLVRHARPRVAPGICYGALDVESDPQATGDAARTLAATLPSELRAHCSPLRRCRQLAQALQTLRTDLRFVTDERLAEMDFGDWEGRRWDAIGQPALDRWTANFRHYRCGGAESVDLFMTRVAAALADASRAGADTLWVTHAGVARAVRLLADGCLSPAAASDWPTAEMGYGTVLCVDVAPAGAG